MRKIFIMLIFGISLLSSSEYGSYMGFEFGSSMSKFKKAGFSCSKGNVIYSCTYVQSRKNTKKIINDPRIDEINLYFLEEDQLFAIKFVTSSISSPRVQSQVEEKASTKKLYSELATPSDKNLTLGEIDYKEFNDYMGLPNFTISRQIENNKLFQLYLKRQKEYETRINDAETNKIKNLKANF
ncbi:MAG: hypothetical protein U9N49_09165 [Campylobacterota bacterium]|nr:hypothetical protein [Campylobacterota bacterium]